MAQKRFRIPSVKNGSWLFSTENKKYWVSEFPMLVWNWNMFCEPENKERLVSELPMLALNCRLFCDCYPLGVINRPNEELFVKQLALSACHGSYPSQTGCWHSWGWGWDGITIGNMLLHLDGLVQDCSNSSALAMKLLQSCIKPSILQCVSNGVTAILH